MMNDGIERSIRLELLSKGRQITRRALQVEADGQIYNEGNAILNAAKLIIQDSEHLELVLDTQDTQDTANQLHYGRQVVDVTDELKAFLRSPDYGWAAMYDAMCNKVRQVVI